MQNEQMKIEYANIEDLIPADYNPRQWSDRQLSDLMESMNRFDIPEPAIVNGNIKRRNIIIGGQMRVEAAKRLGIKLMPVVYVNIPDIEKEKELNLRLNKNTGSFSFELLAKFDESMLANIGFDSEELDEIFEIQSEPEQFDINRELEKLKISKIEVKPGDVYVLGENRLEGQVFLAQKSPIRCPIR